MLIGNVIQEIRKLAAESPDNIYNKPKGSEFCKYDEGICSNGSEGCIVGQAFANLGIKINPEWNNNLSAVAILLRHGCEEINKLNWLETVQFKQDSGLTWSQAVKAADGQWEEEIL